MLLHLQLGEGWCNRTACAAAGGAITTVRSVRAEPACAHTHSLDMPAPPWVKH